MYNFKCDYNEGAHENILRRLAVTNYEQTACYGTDQYCIEARERIGKLIRNDRSTIHFMVGGTQTNTVLIKAALRPHQGAIAVKSAHINTHESGAIEATGHKVLCIDGVDGKLSAADVEAYAGSHYADPNVEHIVQPGLVYISDSTEIGTVYMKAELRALKKVCEKYGMFLYLDGARLGSALTADQNDLTLSDLAELTDAFYIGGTKNGALFGEALVINNPALDMDFRYIMKQHGAMLAKGRLLGIQFLELFTEQEDGELLFFKLAANANQMALRLADGMKTMGIRFESNPVTNQIFPVIRDDVLDMLEKKIQLGDRENRKNGCSTVRFCTSWATTEKAVDEFLLELSRAIKTVC